MFIDSFFHYINNWKHNPFYFVSPLVYAVGNCGEEIYFALLKARRDNKKVIFLYPYCLPHWLVQYRLTNNELFIIDSDYVFFRTNSIGLQFFRGLLTLVYLPLRITSLFLRLKLRIHIKESYSFPRIGLKDLWQPPETLNKFTWENVKSMNWSSQFSTHFPVTLRKASQSEGEKKLENIGLTSNDWFVCIHVRESGFRNDAGRREYRNGDIHTYKKAIKSITDKGGWVIRMGDDSMTRLPKMDKVIDYPFTTFKSDMMDVFLISKCRFYLGCQSGILEIAHLFQKPILIVNMHNWTFNYPLFKNTRGILKHYFSKTENRYLSVKELLTGPWSLQDMNRYVSDTYEIVDNTQEEIKEAVNEYLNLLDLNNFSFSNLQTEANQVRVNTSLDYFSNVRFTVFSDEEETIEKYRFGARIEDSLGTICQAFLEKNWLKNERQES
jgi:putative glycosyltransferase (TIGR04372 family)